MYEKKKNPSLPHIKITYAIIPDLPQMLHQLVCLYSYLNLKKRRKKNLHFIGKRITSFVVPFPLRYKREKKIVGPPFCPCENMHTHLLYFPIPCFPLYYLVCNQTFLIFRDDYHFPLWNRKIKVKVIYVSVCERWHM